MRKTLSEAFEIEEKVMPSKETISDDYDVFEDKILLDSLRNKVIQNIINNGFPHIGTSTKYCALFVNI